MEVTDRRRAYRGVPEEERRAERRARLVAAVLAILAEDGIDAVTVRAVSARAGLTRRYFYESFADLDALLVDVFDGVGRDVVAGIVAAVAEAPRDTHARARAALAGGLRPVTDDPGKARLIVASNNASGALALRRAEVIALFTTVVAAQVRELAGETKISDRMVEMASILLVGGITELIGRWLAGSIDVERDQLVDDCANLFAAAGEAVVRVASRPA